MSTRAYRSTSTLLESNKSGGEKSMTTELRELMEPLRQRVLRQPEGGLNHSYLIPSGYYDQMWDWDAFFMGCHFSEEGHSEHLKNWVLNVLDHVDEDGYVSGCITPKGPRRIFGPFSTKPFLSQGAWIASRELGDTDWLRDRFDTLTRVIDYRIRVQRDSDSGLFFWMNGMQSGADNNPALNYFQDDNRSFLACDISTFQMQESRAHARLAETLGFDDQAARWNRHADELRTAIREHLWCARDHMFYNLDRESGQLYRRVSYSSFMPLIAKVADPDDGREMIRRYLLNEEHLKAPFGLRSLSKQDPDYNNKNIINPYSNWQGPVWPITNYLYSIALHHYGFDEANQWLATTLGELLIKDIRTFGTMHENYHADTGEPLAPAKKHRGPDGNIVGFVSWNLCIQNLLQGVEENRWMLLEI
ncbi:MAG: trehalase family glycosidase [Verrucomicrobiota bacterium]